MEEGASAGPSKPGVDCAFAKPEGMSAERRMAGAIVRSHLVGTNAHSWVNAWRGRSWLLTLSLPIITRRNRFPSRYLVAACPRRAASIRKFRLATDKTRAILIPHDTECKRTGLRWLFNEEMALGRKRPMGRKSPWPLLRVRHEAAIERDTCCSPGMPSQSRSCWICQNQMGST